MTKRKHIEKREVRKRFWFVLDGEEKIQYGVKAAELEHKIEKEERIVTDLKEKVKNHNSTITENSKERRSLLRAIKSGKELRDADAIEVRDFEKKEIRYLVGKKVVETRDMTEEEAQVSMKFKKDEGKKEGVEQRLRKEAEAFRGKKKTVNGTGKSLPETDTRTA